MPLTSTWLTQDGSCALDDIVNQPATLASAPHEDCTSLETRIKLLKPSDGSNSCIIALTPPLQSCWTALVLTSTARTIEVSAQSAGGAMSYISTVRAQPLVGSAWYRATVALKVRLISCLMSHGDLYSQLPSSTLNLSQSVRRQCCCLSCIMP